MLNRLERACRNAQANLLAQHVAHQRDVAEVGVELALGLVFRVALALPRQRQRAHEIATPRHNCLPRRRALFSAGVNRINGFAKKMRPGGGCQRGLALRIIEVAQARQAIVPPQPATD